MIFKRYGYGHIVINASKFIFPITSFALKENTKLVIGNVDFVDFVYLKNNLIKDKSNYIKQFEELFKNINTYAIIDLSKFGDYKDLCEAGNNSLALQILKQTIGALYISIYFNYKKLGEYDCERRIVISDSGVNIVDEGLSSYVSINNDRYTFNAYSISKSLFTSEADLDLDSIKPILEIMKKEINIRNQYENKICKSLEIIYSIINENSSRERVFKWPIIWNYLFREDNGDININFITKKLKAIFNIISPQKILEQIPNKLVNNLNDTSKISKIVEDIYIKIRNKIMHGHIRLYEEYTVCTIENIIIYKVITLELIHTLCQNEFLESCTSTNELNKFISTKEREYVKQKKKLNNH